MSTYGLLSNVQRGVLAPFVRDRVVHDLGAGDLTLAYELARWARVVVAIDREEMPEPTNPRVVHLRRVFRDHLDQIDVAFEQQEQSEAGEKLVAEGFRVRPEGTPGSTPAPTARKFNRRRKS